MSGGGAARLPALREFGLVVLAAWATGWVATGVCRRLALRWGIVDRPNQGTKPHGRAVPYLGGLGIYAGLGAGVLAALPGAGPEARHFLLAVLGAGALTGLVGLWDDLRPLRARTRLLTQAAAAVGVATLGLGWGDGETWPAVLGAVVLVLAASNALNLLDGLDGLCGGVTLIMAVGYLTLGVATGAGASGVVPLALALVGALLAFLHFNRPPARIFMGDAGSLLLGLVAGSLVLRLSQSDGRLVGPALTILGLPALDTTVALWRRARNGRSLFAPDRGHLYDQLLERGLGLRRTIWLCYGVTLGTVALALVLRPLVPWAQGLVASAVWTGAAVLVVRGGFLRMRGIHGAAPARGTQTPTASQVQGCSH